MSKVDQSHYDVFEVKLTKEEIKTGVIRLDPYRVASEWRTGEKDPSGCLFHILKNICRFGTKVGNSKERELTGIMSTLTRLVQLSKEE